MTNERLELGVIEPNSFKRSYLSEVHHEVYMICVCHSGNLLLRKCSMLCVVMLTIKLRESEASSLANVSSRIHNCIAIMKGT